MSDAEHRELLDHLLKLKGMVVLSGYPSRIYAEALQSWHMIERQTLADGARPRTEVLWLNPAVIAASGTARYSKSYERRSHGDLATILQFRSGCAGAGRRDRAVFAEHGPHYSRRTPGSRTFTGVGQEVVLRPNAAGLLRACVRQKTPAARGTAPAGGEMAIRTYGRASSGATCCSATSAPASVRISSARRPRKPIGIGSESV